jgi:hypothetical protein
MRTHRTTWQTICIVIETIATFVVACALLALPFIASWIHYGLTGHP